MGPKMLLFWWLMGPKMIFFGGSFLHILYIYSFLHLRPICIPTPDYRHTVSIFFIFFFIFFFYLARQGRKPMPTTQVALFNKGHPENFSRCRGRQLHWNSWLQTVSGSHRLKTPKTKDYPAHHKNQIMAPVTGPKSLTPGRWAVHAPPYPWGPGPGEGLEAPFPTRTRGESTLADAV
jgi:hypothetical protein